jgi:hypothetical protein
MELVLMDLYTAPRPLSEMPSHIIPLLPDDLIAHLSQQFPTDEELADMGDYQWAELRSKFTLPHFQELSARRQAVRALDNQKGTPNDEP